MLYIRNEGQKRKPQNSSSLTIPTRPPPRVPHMTQLLEILGASHLISESPVIWLLSHAGHAHVGHLLPLAYVWTLRTMECSCIYVSPCCEYLASLSPNKLKRTFLITLCRHRIPAPATFPEMAVKRRVTCQSHLHRHHHCIPL